MPVRLLIALSLLPLGLLGAAQAWAQPAPPETLAANLPAADAFIGRVYAAGDADQYDAAAQTYLSVLERLGGPLGDGEAGRLLWHLRYARMVLPPEERAALGLDEALRQNDLAALTEGAGERLVRWWRRQDTHPATFRNERLEEHLARVAYALAAFADEDDVRGFDDRGEVFVRLGEPQRRRAIELDAARYRQEGIRPSLPDNELWTYRHVSDAAHYLFVRTSRRKPYRLAEATDLIPGRLRGGPRQAWVLLRVLEDVYGQLALESGDYGTIYDEVADYVGLPTARAGRPHQVALDVLGHAHMEDQNVEVRRRELVPASYSNAYDAVEPLPVALRWARFLDADGTTRTEVYWGLEADALRPSRRLRRRLKKGGASPSDEYLLTASVAQRAPSHATRRIHSKQYLIPDEASGLLAGRLLQTRGDTAAYHLALQWDAHWLEPSETDPDKQRLGPRLKIGLQAVDTLRALDGTGQGLEMSDLKPLLRGEAGGDALYPYAHLTSEMPLALYFEVYHLGYGDGDQARYTVEYEVVRDGDARSGRGSRAAAQYTSPDRTAEEYIELDLSDEAGAQHIEIRVRVTDETTGQQAERAIAFTVHP